LGERRRFLGNGGHWVEKKTINAKPVEIKKRPHITATFFHGWRKKSSLDLLF